MRVGSLFSGIGGFDLGFERAGFRTVWFVEKDPFCQKVLREHWPNTKIYEDICAVDWSAVASVDVLVGGFPCQDISTAGKGAGITGKRSGLWFEMLKAIRALRPKYVVMENVPALTFRGLDTVLGGLSECGYNAEWQVLPSSAFGMSHKRERIFIVAYPDRYGWKGVLCDDPEGSPKKNLRTRPQPALGSVWDCLSRLEEELGEPSVFGTDDGLPNRVDRLRACGNAVVPQVAQWIAERIRRQEKV